MLELLNLCGFNDAEAESQLPRVKKAFQRLNITDKDISNAKERLFKYYDIRLSGIRKIIRLCLLEVINSILAREEGKKKIIFQFMSPGMDAVGSVLMSKSKDVLSAHHSWAFLVVAGCIFDKLAPVLEAAESSWLKSGTVSHCSNVKSLLGLFATDIMPKPDLMITTGYSCEAAPKTVDLLQELFGIPGHCCDTCQDREFTEYTEASRRTIDMAASSLKKLVGRIQNITGIEVTDNDLTGVMEIRKEFNDSMRKVRLLIENSDPLPLSSTHDTLLMALNSLTFSIDEMPAAVEALNTLHKELETRVSNGTGVVKKGAPRILAILPAHHADPRLEHLVEEMGLALVASDPGFNVPYTNTSMDPYILMSLHLQMSLATSLPRRVPLIIDGCRRLKINGVLNRYHVGCRAVAGDPFIIASAVNKELGIPVLTLQWENFDTRIFNEEQYRQKLEAFKEMLSND